MVWKSLLPYRVEFEVTTTRVERPHLLEGDAVGELAGVGRWRLYEQDGVTAVLYEWNVSTTKAWMNLLAPIARPVFEWNHDWVMARGGEGIAAVCSAAACWPAADGAPSSLSFSVGTLHSECQAPQSAKGLQSGFPTLTSNP